MQQGYQKQPCKRSLRIGSLRSQQFHRFIFSPSHLFSFLLLCLFFWDKASLCSIDCPETCYVNLLGLKLMEIHELVPPKCHRQSLDILKLQHIKIIIWRSSTFYFTCDQTQHERSLKVPFKKAVQIFNLITDEETDKSSLECQFMAHEKVKCLW